MSGKLGILSVMSLEKVFNLQSQLQLKVTNLINKAILNHYTFLGNCPPTPPLS